MKAVLIQFEIKDPTTSRRCMLHRALYGARFVQRGVEGRLKGIMEDIPNVALAPHIHIIGKKHVDKALNRVSKWAWAKVTCRPVEVTAADEKALAKPKKSK